MYRLWLALATATIAISAIGQISFDERDSNYSVTAVSTSYADILYSYTMQLFLHSGSAKGEDYMWDWTQKLDAMPTPPTVSSDVAFSYVGKMLNGKYRYVFHLKDNAQHYIRFDTNGTVGATFANSWIARDDNPGDGHSSEILFEGGGFLSSPAALYKVNVQLPNFIIGEGDGPTQVQVLSETAAHTLDTKDWFPFSSGVKATRAGSAWTFGSTVS